ncbi:Trk system potassium transporter TrkA [Flavobacteriaceae bacterium]|nr:Trk system potassium transporter TrkA [Flavobacteriaceae bacterium]MDB2672997.1 Trk system potassium transporter TrkA [Flavobacteriaceae bacterium]MDB4187085.1 Trk system potassium transporter TrkA [Flavobacteriaceae bacterium]MDB9823895.1 Trk system potassium transporter TrkA [Flavobacteriaceae bacterium]MDB9886022.1 Trk system potassium transporter TrkA [Flavobacteriaceae bacterium]
MKIIIAGAGEVGFHLAKLLSFESQDITLIDTHKERLNYAENHLDIKAIKGDATSLRIMKEAKIDTSDLFIAVTEQETTNITICALAKQMGCKKTIARISSSEFINHNDEVSFEKLGVDELISPEELASIEIQQLLDQSAFSDSYEFENGALTLLGTTLEESVPFVGKTVKEAAQIFPDIHFMPIALQRKGTQYTIIPRGDTQFEANDLVYFITLKEGVEELYKLTGRNKEVIKNVMILGGGKIGYSTAKTLADKKFNVILVEQNKNKAFELADQLPDVMVINGDGRNVELLEEEGLEAMDAFICVTENSETNIMSCLMAKSKNVKKAIALVENMDYFQLSHSIGIDTLINKKLLTANTIFRYIRRGEVVDLTTLNSLNAEILEFIVKPESKVNGMQIRDIDFPRSATIGGVIKEGEGVIALGGYKIEAGDRVVVCCLPRALDKVESLFL